jgi:protoheme ferro-lyase
MDLRTRGIISIASFPASSHYSTTSTAALLCRLANLTLHPDAHSKVRFISLLQHLSSLFVF